MLLGTLGLRTRTLTALNIENIELMGGTMWVREKGCQHRSIGLPLSLCKMIQKYLQPQSSFHLNDNDVDILIIQSILGHASPRSTEPYIHPSHDRIRNALEKLPGIQFVKKLIRNGELDLKFQRSYKPKR
jgi:site-specific recombinase XerD